MSEREKPNDSQPAPDRGVPGVSIVIPCYNYAEFLPEAIDSALAQDYAKVEVIVVDDGSTDNTHEVVASYGYQIRYVYRDNGGLSAARNTGIKALRTPFVLFLDADDLLESNMVSACMDRFAQLPDDYAVVACKHRFVDIEGEPLAHNPKNDHIKGEITFADILLKNRFIATAMVRAKVFEDCGTFDTNLTSSEDRDMWLRIARRYRIDLIPDELFLYRTHSGSMSRDARRMNDNMTTVLKRAIGNAGYSLPASKVLAFKDYQVSWMYNAQGRRTAAIICILRSILRWPCFLNPAEVENPKLFRLRALRRFLFGCRKETK